MMNLGNFIFVAAAYLHVATSVIYENQYEKNTGLKIPVGHREPREVTLSERSNCDPFDVQPPNRHDTTTQVNTLMSGMADRAYDAYVVPSSDEHQDEYVAESEKRRQYISGFTGSAGTAVILTNGSRALWTDGRYFLQADDELDCNWLLMKDGMEGVPSISEWLIASLDSGATISADARLIGADSWIAFQNALEASSLTVVVDQIDNGNDLLDEQWNVDGRPTVIRNSIYDHDVKFAGKSWQYKVIDVETEMENYGVSAFVVTALDEIAWLLNLRGSDIPYNPVFQSYVIIDMSSGRPANISLFIDGNLTTSAEKQLGIGKCVPEEPCVSLFTNNDIESAVVDLVGNPSVEKIMISSAFSYSLGASYFIYNLVSESKRALHPSPILLMKAQKNPVEQEGMKTAHIKDATALISFMAFLEKQITRGSNWTELQAQKMLAEYRYLQADFMGLSFETISAFGADAAIIHYTASPETDTLITNQNLYLLDSGGQYLDGTTDVTRTMHFGTPTAKQIEAYTRVLKGVIDFASIIIPKGTGKYYTDALARRALYKVGLDYRHGTSHGIGMFMFVHEASDIVYELGFCGSDEPGYYEDGQFGIRIENVILTVNASTKYSFIETSYGFETLTLVPYEPKLINLGLLDKYQCQFLNEYNQKIRDIMGPVLVTQNIDGYNYMLEKTNYSC